MKVLSTDGLTKLIQIIKSSFLSVDYAENTVESDTVQVEENSGVEETEEINIVSSVDSSSTNNEVVGAKLFYDTCGDIETLINAL